MVAAAIILAIDIAPLQIPRIGLDASGGVSI
jgi:hypothetical protein